MPLIQTKTLIPRDRKGLLRRDRLVDFLHDNVDRQLILISASAGYGKTTLLTDFAGDTDLPVCWYTADETDRNLRDFLEYFVAAIEQVFQGRLPETRRVLATWGGDSQGEALAGLLVNEIHQNIPDLFVLVIDDYHLVDDIVAINLFLDSFLRHQPDNCRLIIASRTIPTLTPRGMALLVASQQIAGLSGNDLRFTAQEIHDLILQNYQQDISLEQAEELARESEGWITAILLTRHRMWEGLIADMIRKRTGSSGSLYDYLANEVFSQLDASRQDFLQATSILDVMSPALCDALLDRHDSRAILEDLEDRNLFTTRGEGGSEVWYRYHRLFREFLAAKLTSRAPAREIALHIRAGRYLEKEGDAPAAIRHYLGAGGYRDAGRLMEQVAQATYDAGRLDGLLYWIDALPEDVLRQAPRLAWFKAKILCTRGKPELSTRYADMARQGFERAGDTVGVAQALIDKCASLRLAGRLPEALAASEEALAALQGLSLQGAEQRVLAGVYRNLGICHVQLGQTDQGIEEMREALRLFELAGYSQNIAQIHNDLGVALRGAGNLSGSHLHFEQALGLWEQEGNAAGIASCLNSIGVSYHLRGQYDKALDVYGIALKRAQEAASDRMAGFIHAGMGDSYLAGDDVDHAIESYEAAQELAQRATDRSLAEYVLGGLSMAYLLRGDTTQSLDLARQAYERARERNSRHEAATYQITLGAVYTQCGRTRRALDCLTQAVGTLRESRAYRDLARAQLHLAQAYYRAGRPKDALDALEELTDTILELGQDRFLTPEARMTLPLLDYAVERSIGGEILVKLAEKAHDGQGPSAGQEPLAVAEAPARAGAGLRCCALGDARVFRGDDEIPNKAWGMVKARQLWFYLLSSPPQRKEQLYDMFWPETAPAKVRSAFHVCTFRLRRALEMNEALVFEDEKYQLNRDLNVWYDVAEFERLLSEAGRQDSRSPAEAADLRCEAIDLVHGEFCADLPPMPWILEKRNILQMQFLDTLSRLGDYQLAGRDYAAALQSYRRMLAADNLREDAHRNVMRCLRALGDRSGALKQYQVLRELLAIEMQAEPEPETQRLYDDIASGDQDSTP